MHVQIVNFRLKGMSDGEFRKLCDDLTPTFAALPGLQVKLWLADPATNTYGGVYLWEARQAMERFVGSELFHGVETHPNFSDVRSQDFDILEGPTRATRGYATDPA